MLKCLEGRHRERADVRGLLLPVTRDFIDMLTRCQNQHAYEDHTRSCRPAVDRFNELADGLL